MVVVVVMLSVTLIAIVPLQFGLECVVLLGEVLLPVVVGVAPPVSPLEGVRGGHVDVLEVVIPGVGAVSLRLLDPEDPGASPSPSPGLTAPTPGITTSSTSTCPPRTPSSGATGGATLTTTGSSTSHRRTTHSRPS